MALLIRFQFGPLCSAPQRSVRFLRRPHSLFCCWESRSLWESKVSSQNLITRLCRSWDGWLNGKLQGREMIIPDVSRVYRRPYEGLSEQAEFLTELFNRARHTNLYVNAMCYVLFSIFCFILQNLLFCKNKFHIFVIADAYEIDSIPLCFALFKTPIFLVALLSFEHNHIQKGDQF